MGLRTLTGQSCPTCQKGPPKITESLEPALFLHLTPHCCLAIDPEDTVQCFWSLRPAFRLLEKQGIQKPVTTPACARGF